jgi:hypothetical protein
MRLTFKILTAKQIKNKHKCVFLDGVVALAYNPTTWEVEAR